MLPDVEDNSLNGINGVDFTLGFSFDGHDVYEDLAENPIPGRPELSTLYVYDDPVITTFKEDYGQEILVREGRAIPMALSSVCIT